jgi:hypothetical protein
MSAKLILFLSCFAAVMLTASAVNAAPRGGGGHGGHHGGHGAHFSSISPRGRHYGGHGAHFSSISPRGRHTFSRNGSKFRRGTSATYANWSHRNWSGRNWSGGNWSGDWSSFGYWGGGSRFISIGGGYPYYSNWYPYWGWGYPYLYSYYSYYPYTYYPSYWYAYDSCSASRQRFFGP